MSNALAQVQHLCPVPVHAARAAERLHRKHRKHRMAAQKGCTESTESKERLLVTLYYAPARPSPPSWPRRRSAGGQDPELAVAALDGLPRVFDRLLARVLLSKTVTG